MPTESASPIPLVLIFTTVGFIVGAVVAYIAARSQPGKAPKSVDFDLFNERKKRFDEVAGLYRERAGGKLVVWFEDKIWESSKAIDSIRRRRLESAERDFSAWLGTDESATAVEVGKNSNMENRLASVTRTPTGPLASPTRTPTGPLSSPARTPTGPLSSPTRPPTGPLTAPKKTPTGPLSAPEPAVRPVEVSLPAALAEEPAKAAKPSKPLSIVEQINDILQEMIKDTPLANRMLRLVEDPREGVVVWVGMTHYPGVDSVPDPEIKAALRKAANEWERRTETRR